MRIDLKKGAYVGVEVLLYPVSKEQLKVLKADGAISGKICQIRKLGDFSARRDEHYLFAPDNVKGVKRVMVVGLGDADAVDHEVVRRAYAVAVKEAHARKITKVSTIIPDIKMDIQLMVSSLIEGVELGNYRFQKYLTGKDATVRPIDALTIYCGTGAEVRRVKDVVGDTQTICKYVGFARDLVNENSGQTYSSKFYDMVKGECAKNKLKVTKLGEGALKRLNMNLMLAVNAGSDYPPLLLEIEYAGNRASKKRIALVGKGLTFDTGGLNLKPTKFIEDMKLDMAGAAAVVAAINCAARMKLKQNIVATIPLVENMIGPGAFKPGDVFMSHAGKSVEIRNTDAEGRLALADALSYTIKKYKPSLVIDLATLTGACLVALGEYCAGAMTNNQEHLDTLKKSSEITGENIWQLPLYDDLAKGIKSDIADLKNSASSKFGGSIHGGLFLKEFVGDTPWIHLDIAGPAFFEKEHYYMKKGGTGFGVRLLVDFLKGFRG